MDNSEAVSVHKQAFIHHCISASYFAIIYYDYLLTLPAEYSRYWTGKRKISFASIMFYLNRYLTFLGHIPVILQVFWAESDASHIELSTRHHCQGLILPPDSCVGLTKFHKYLVSIGNIVIGVCLILRTYALYGRTWRILAALGTVAAAEIIYTLYQMWKGTSTPYTMPPGSGFLGCLLPVNEPSSSQLGHLWIGLLLFDVLIFVLTLYKALTGFRDGVSSVLNVILRDGTMYFGVMIIAAIVGILDFRLFSPYIRGITASYGNALSSVMVSRLMLNLRDPELGHSVGTQPSVLTTMVWNHNVATSIESQGEGGVSA
ncbi:hypothetical protein GALMADRAFT_137042 [Galerina marginata CBS 339.88]|uniref:DUF6533 domain-containing protein n=1 Tax=Galerina marginata (strain CBS 339.88) TaxID=685588 RepID=A0A067T9V7_GALM3|nr:hypothetical protein GALMADRAFT_137042 [Galerina marginata CBS 339.88]